MPQAPHPRMHGLTHVAGGSDPVPGLIPYPTGDTIDEKILAALPAGFWKLNESSGTVAADSSGHGQDLATTGAELPPVWGRPAGPPGESSADFQNGTGSTAARVSRSWPGIAGSFTVGIWVSRNTDQFTMAIGQGTPIRGTAAGWMLAVTADATTPPDQNKPIVYMRGTGGEGLKYVAALNPLAPDTWAFLAAAYNADTDRLSLYVNGLLEGSTTVTYPGASSLPLWIGHDGGTGGGSVLPAYFTGSYGFLVNRAMSGTELEDITAAGGAGTPTDTDGLVLGLDENGNPAWVHPTVEVTGGGVNPSPVDETPADSSEPAATGPTTSTGWHLNGHFETVVLHDPNPGRFDVATMKWERVPFTSITIYRTWEPTVSAAVLKTARLKDDRGLTQAAKNGILHINPDMVWPDAPPMNVWIDDAIVSHPEHHLVEGWFSIEYPVLDARYLPENDVELLTLGPTPDAPRPGVDVLVADGYQRAARFMNVSTGSVLRFHAGSTDRAIINWWFWGTADDSSGNGDGPGSGNLDNPLPIWGDWPARPIHMTPPYPQLNPTDSRAYYHDYQGMAGLGFGPFRGLTAGTNLAAGANLCMQAWQDTPWLLRFSTARFPAYRGYDQDYNGFPHLAVTYHYDPDTINHTTGRLLLPAT